MLEYPKLTYLYVHRTRVSIQFLFGQFASIENTFNILIYLKPSYSFNQYISYIYLIIDTILYAYVFF